MKKFKIDDRIVGVSHLWKTHSAVHGSRRFAYIYRLCNLLKMKSNGTHAVIQLVGLKSKPRKTVPFDQLICIDDINTKHFILSS